MEMRYAKRMENITGSEIREAIKLALRPGMISFAGGLPAPEMFPVEEMKEASRLVLDEAGAVAMQYSTTEGFDPLREKIVARMKEKYGIQATKDNILNYEWVTAGIGFFRKAVFGQG